MNKTYNVDEAVQAQKEYRKEYAAKHSEDWASEMMKKIISTMDVSVKIELPLTRDEALYLYEELQNKNPNSETLALIISWLKALPATAEIKAVKNMQTGEVEIQRVKQLFT